MSYSIKRPRIWGIKQGNIRWYGPFCVLISCFLCLSLFYAVSAQAEIRVRPSSISVVLNAGSTDDISHKIRIYNSKEKPISFHWDAWSDQGWIILTEHTGSSSGTGANVTLTISPKDRPAGIYTGTVYVSTNATQETYPLKVNVTMKIGLTKNGKLGVSPSSLDFVAKKWESSPIKRIRVFNKTDNYNKFEWSAVASDWWIQLYKGHSCDQPGNDSLPSSSVGCNNATIGCQCLDVSIDSEHMQPGDYNGTITVYSDLETNSTETIKITARVDEPQEISTSSWLNLQLKVPQNDLRDENGNPANFYLLVEHPSLLPGQVYAYQCKSDNNKTTCSLKPFSQWGHLVPHADGLAYQSDREWDLQQDVLTVPFGGFRLIGLEGDIIIHGMVGTPRPGQDWGMTQLLKYTLHVVPITGTWIVTDESYGEAFTYPDPLVLYESRGQLEGTWKDVRLDQKDPENNINYVNSSDMLPGYKLHFTEWSPGLRQNFEYWYQITDLTRGHMQGFWRYRGIGEKIWSVRQPFSAVLQGVTIPLDPNCNCYLVNGTVNGYATPFIVDTGAEVILLNSAGARYMGVDLTNPGQCPYTDTVSGVGGGIPTTFCYVNIQIEGQLSRDNVLVGFSDNWTGPALLGMTFLDQFHISTNAKDGTMTIVP